MYNCVWYFCTYPYGLSLNVWHALLCIANNRHGVTITTHAIKRHFLIWMTTVRHPTKRRCSCVLTLKYTFICVYWWTRQRIHNTLIVVDRYLRLMGDKMIPDSAEPCLESFYPPFVAGIDLPHQGVVDSYNTGSQIHMFAYIIIHTFVYIIIHACTQPYKFIHLQTQFWQIKSYRSVFVLTKDTPCYIPPHIFHENKPKHLITDSCVCWDEESRMWVSCPDGKVYSPLLL